MHSLCALRLLDMLSFIKRNHQPLFYIAWCLVSLIRPATQNYLMMKLITGYMRSFPTGAILTTLHDSAADQSRLCDLPQRIRRSLLYCTAQYSNHFYHATIAGQKGRLPLYAIASSIAIVQIGGIIAVPDIPLLFLWPCTSGFTSGL